MSHSYALQLLTHFDENVLLGVIPLLEVSTPKTWRRRRCLKNSYADKKRHRVDHASYNSIQDSLFLVQWNWSSPSRTILRATKIYPSSASHRASSLNLLKSWEEISITLIEKYRGSKIPLSESTNPTYRSKGIEIGTKESGNENS